MKSQPVTAELALYQKLVAASPGVELKGATHPYTSLNGNIPTSVLKSGTHGTVAQL